MHIHSSKFHEFCRNKAGEDGKERLLNESNLLLVPSRLECQPMVVIEAQSCGLPVIASPAVAEVIDGFKIRAHGIFQIGQK